MQNNLSTEVNMVVSINDRESAQVVLYLLVSYSPWWLVLAVCIVPDLHFSKICKLSHTLTGDTLKQAIKLFGI